MYKSNLMSTLKEIMNQSKGVEITTVVGPCSGEITYVGQDYLVVEGAIVPFSSIATISILPEFEDEN